VVFSYSFLEGFAFQFCGGFPTFMVLAPARGCVGTFLAVYDVPYMFTECFPFPLRPRGALEEG